MKRLKYCAIVNPSLPREHIPSPDDLVSFLPMEKISEKGVLDLSEVRPAREISHGYTSIFEGDIVVAKITPCFENGKGALCLGLHSRIGYGTTELIVLRPKPQTDPRFLYWLTYSHEFRKLGEAEMTGSAGQKRVTEKFVSSFRLPVISKEAQYKISSYLDEQTIKIDRLLDMRRRQIELLKEQRTALIQQAVTRGLNPDVPMKDSGIEWLGEIPAHWEVLRNKILFREIDQRSVTGREELLTVSHITGVTSRKEKEEVTMFLSESNEGYKLCDTGDLAINTMWAFMGALGFSSIQGIVSPSYNVYRFRKSAVQAYYEYLFHQANFIVEIRRYSKGIWDSRLRLYPGSFFEIRSPFPPPEEQSQIVEYIAEATNKTEDALSSYSRQITLLSEYRAALIHECVTGQRQVPEIPASLQEEAHAL